MSIIEVRPRTPWAMLMDKMKLLACGMLTVIAAPLAAMLMLGGQLVVVALIVARAALVRIAHRPRPQPGKGHGCPGHGCPYEQRLRRGDGLPLGSHGVYFGRQVQLRQSV